MIIITSENFTTSNYMDTTPGRFVQEDILSQDVKVHKFSVFFINDIH